MIGGFASGVGIPVVSAGLGRPPPGRFLAGLPRAVAAAAVRRA